MEQNVQLILMEDQDSDTFEVPIYESFMESNVFEEDDQESSKSGDRIKNIEKIYTAIQKRQYRITLLDGKWMGVERDKDGNE